MARNKGFSDRTRIKYRFKQDDFDFFFQCIMGGQMNGGAEAGECFLVASEIQEGDTDSWFAAWTALAKRVEARAKTSLERGHLVSARESFLRAYSYYRAPLLFMDPKDSRYCKIYKMARVCFRQAALAFISRTLSGSSLGPRSNSYFTNTSTMYLQDSSYDAL